MSTTTVTDGADGFVADLHREGLRPERDGDVVYYDLVPVAGAFAGQTVRTGVTVAELAGWPAAPPHWVHLKDDVEFAATNADGQYCPPGWRRHSRDTGQWDTDRPAIHVWLAHVRGVLGEAL
ncbi:MULTISPECIES: hypothetical protein [unclassified Aeromicrobium]|uniref:hypothetical protein n=1 Tax=unclassified Aeromicrobium TaxID=2633570 RepID=UPI002096F9B3|nr:MULTISPECIES: hypothetical protein [unclassified Aeromicrobium]MCO7238192.1 hypothetical protein [Aeromicrobium sp. CnD17-E]MDR6117875.1 hypothetical protein [Aeromicrobium sp. SORGH_AS_0981]